MSLVAYMYVLVCLSGPSCPSQPITGSKIYYGEKTCEEDAKLVAQGMYVMGKNKYGFRCERVDYDPPKLDQR